MKKNYNIKFNKAEKTGEVLLYGYIGDDGWWSGSDNPLDIDRFIKDFNDLEKKCDRINIRINSPGGYMGDGLPIYNAIARSEKDTHTYCDGYAASMAAVILLAGKTVHSASNGIIMFHSPSSIVWGNAVEMRKEAEALDVWEDSIATNLAEKSGKTKDEIKSTYFDGDDHWLNANIAKDLGFVDIVESYDAKDMPNDVSNLNYNKVMSSFKENEIADKLANNKGFMDKMKSILNYKPKQKEMKKEDAVAKINSFENLTDAEKAQIVGFINDFSEEDIQNAKKEVPEDVTKKLDASEKTIKDVSAIFGDAAKEETFDVVASVTELKTKADKADGEPTPKPKKKDDMGDGGEKTDFSDPSMPWNANANKALGL